MGTAGHDAGDNGRPEAERGRGMPAATDRSADVLLVDRARRRHRARDRRRRDAGRPAEPARVRPARRGVPVAAAHDRARRRVRARARAPRGRRARLLRHRGPPRAVRGGRRDRRRGGLGLVAARAHGPRRGPARRSWPAPGRCSAASPDHEATLREVAGLVVPAAADRIAVDVVEADGLRRIASAPASASSDTAASDAALRLVEVVRTGEPALLDDTAILPLRARDVVVGVLTIGSTTAPPVPGSPALAFARELAAECATAIDNARLHQELRDSEEALRRSNDQLGAILGGVADGVLARDAEGHVVYANAAAAVLLERPSADALRRTPLGEVTRWVRLYDEAGSLVEAGDLPGARLLRGDAAPDRLLRFEGIDTGVERWVLVKARAVRGPDREAAPRAPDLRGRDRAQPPRARRALPRGGEPGARRLARLRGDAAHDLRPRRPRDRGRVLRRRRGAGRPDPQRRDGARRPRVGRADRGRARPAAVVRAGRRRRRGPAHRQPAPVSERRRRRDGARRPRPQHRSSCSATSA